MFAAAALVPSPPLLVPELTGGAADETDDLRVAVRTVVSELAEHARSWIAVGAGPVATSIAPPIRGTFRGYGMDVEVSFGAPTSSSATDDGPADPGLPLAALVAGWVRGAYAPNVDVRMHVLPPQTTPSDCSAFGRELRKSMDCDDTPRGLLVVGDGANTLSPGAPGGYDSEAESVQAALSAALADGDAHVLADLDHETAARFGIGGRMPWQILAGVFGQTRPRCVTEYSAAPYGVAYHVGMWMP